MAWATMAASRDASAAAAGVAAATIEIDRARARIGRRISESFEIGGQARCRVGRQRQVAGAGGGGLAAMPTDRLVDGSSPAVVEEPVAQTGRASGRERGCQYV